VRARARTVRATDSTFDNFRPSITAVEIAELALKLSEFEGGRYSDKDFKQKFGFAFNLLVDADLQLQILATKTTNDRTHARSAD